MRNIAQPDWREVRWPRAWEHKQPSRKQRAVAAVLGVMPSTISQWLKQERTESVEVLRRNR
jgi:transcriptional regulator with XRE-family HTH domain